MMTHAICSYMSNHAAVPLVAMLINCMYEAVLMANISIIFISCKNIELLDKLIFKKNINVLIVRVHAT